MGRLTKKREKTHIAYVSYETGDINTDPADMKKIVKNATHNSTHKNLTVLTE